VSIWRLTTQQQVWYEWHAESFLPIIPIAANADVALSASISNGSVGFGSTSPLTSALLDADASMEGMQAVIEPLKATASTFETVKIGQTGLHNPGGRSSWIGL
jgi:protein arginine N-methyltransferase 5